MCFADGNCSCSSVAALTRVKNVNNSIFYRFTIDIVVVTRRIHARNAPFGKTRACARENTGEKHRVYRHRLERESDGGRGKVRVTP